MLVIFIYNQIPGLNSSGHYLIQLTLFLISLLNGRL